jgi:hypothetical protein
MCISTNSLFTIGELLRTGYSFSGTRTVSCNEDEHGTETCRPPVELRGDSPSAWSSIPHGDICSNLNNIDECNKEAFQRFDRRVQNVAASVSIEIRRNDDNPESTVKGTAWIIRKHISHLLYVDLVD